MKQIIWKIALTIFIFCFGVIPSLAQTYNMGDPFSALKKEIESRHTLLTFQTGNISAIYPTEKISSISINFPGYRGPGQLVIYSPEFGQTTGTNEFGTEAVVEDGVVVKLSGADSLIPKNGFVVSGHGRNKQWIKNNLKIGTNVIIDKNIIIAYTTPESYIFSAKEKILEAEDFIANAKKNTKDYDEKKAVYYLKKAKSEYKKAEKSKEEFKKAYADSALKLAGLSVKYALPYIEDEFKGVWVRPVERNVYEIRKTLDKIKKTGINEVFLETYFHGYTIYPSNVMKNYGLTVQNPKFLMFDPLKVYIDEAHKRGMKIHCWFEAFYVGNASPAQNQKSILAVYPSWGNKNLANYKAVYVKHPTEHNGYFLDPANPEVIAFLTDIIGEICSKYNIDGLNLDYTRYPTSQKSNVSNYRFSNWGYTDVARKEFMGLYEVDPVEIEPDSVLWKKWCEYRQEKLFEFVKTAKTKIKDGILFSAVIFPNYDICLETKQQDWSKWSREGLIDAVTPLIMTSDNELFEKILKQVKSKVTNKTTVLTGLFVGFLDAEPEDLLKQISVSRAYKTGGIVLFDWAHLPQKYQNALQYRVFLPNKK